MNRGSRLTEMLKQNQFQPLTMEEQVCVVYAGVRGFLDKVDTKKIVAYEKAFMPYLKKNGAAILADIKATKKLSKENDTSLNKLYQAYTAEFLSGN